MICLCFRDVLAHQGWSNLLPGVTCTPCRELKACKHYTSATRAFKLGSRLGKVSTHTHRRQMTWITVHTSSQTNPMLSFLNSGWHGRPCGFPPLSQCGRIQGNIYSLTGSWVLLSKDGLVWLKLITKLAKWHVEYILFTKPKAPQMASQYLQHTTPSVFTPVSE